MYYHTDSIKDYIKKFPDLNNGIKAVQEDIANELFLAEARTLGIIDKILTVSLSRIIESKSTVLDLNPVLLRLNLDLSSCVKMFQQFFKDSDFFGDTEVEFHEDQVFAKLFADVNDAFDIMTQQALEVIFHVL